MSETIPVTPINPIADRRAQDFRRTIEESDESSDSDGGRRRVLDGRVQDEGPRARSRQDDFDPSRGFAPLLDETGAPVRPAGHIPYTSTPNAAFVAQVIHQDFLGPGLHIEPWSRAMDAYRRAGAESRM